MGYPAWAMETLDPNEDDNDKDYIAAYRPWQTPRLRSACADKAPSLGAGEMTGRQAHGAAWLLGDGRDPRTSAEAKAVKVLDWDAEHKNQPEQ